VDTLNVFFEGRSAFRLIFKGPGDERHELIAASRGDSALHTRLLDLGFTHGDVRLMFDGHTLPLPGQALQASVS